MLVVDDEKNPCYSRGARSPLAGVSGRSAARVDPRAVIMPPLDPWKNANVSGLAFSLE